MYFMAFKKKPENVHIISAWWLSWVSEKPQIILMEIDSYSTFVGIWIDGAVNDISVLQSLLKLLRPTFSRSCHTKLY